MKPGSGTVAGRSSMSMSSPSAKAWRKRTTPRKRVAGTPESPRRWPAAPGEPLLVVLAHLRGLERGSSGTSAVAAMPEAWAGAGG